MAASIEEIWDQLTADGAQYSWSVQDIRGVPTRCYDNAPSNIREVWELSAAHGDAEYLVFEDERRTYAEIHDEVRRLAAHLVDEHGVGVGDRIAIAMRNYPEWIVAYWAIIATGAAAVGMNAWWTGPEMEYGLGDSTPKLLICDQERLERLLPHLESVRASQRLPILIARGETPPGVSDIGTLESVTRAAGDAPELPDVEIDPEHDCCIFYTSGTTGFPKGAVMTHRAVVTNMLNLAFWNTVVAMTKPDEEKRSKRSGDEPRRQPAVLLAVPLFHVTGCNCCLHPYTALGGRLILMYKWDPGEALRIIEDEKVIAFTGVPVMSRELVDHPDFDRYDTSSLAALGGGGAPMQPDLVHKIDDKLPEGRPGTGYGLTETTGVVSMNSDRFYVDNPSSVGPPLPVMETKVIDDDGNELPVGEVGELCVRGANVISGYFNKPEATAEAIVDGWFRTGDIAYLDDRNFITIADRAKDMVLRGGENIYCAEVEAAIFDHPAVRECAVFAVPDERLGEVPGVAIVLKEGATMAPDEVKNHAEGRIAPFKIPEHVWFMDEPLPRNANGKFLKRELREQLVEGA